MTKRKRDSRTEAILRAAKELSIDQQKPDLICNGILSEIRNWYATTLPVVGYFAVLKIMVLFSRRLSDIGGVSCLPDAVVCFLGVQRRVEKEGWTASPEQIAAYVATSLKEIRERSWPLTAEVFQGLEDDAE